MVVKCKKCGLYFTSTEQDTKCRFCKTESVEIVENLPAQAGDNKEPKKKKETAKARKESFKIW